MKKNVYSKILNFKSQKSTDDDPFIMRVRSYATTEKPDRYGEITDKDAFAKAMPKFMGQNGAVSMYNHQTNIGKILDYEKDTKGVIVEVGIANTSTGRDVAELVKIGAVSRMSFAFGNSEYEKEGKYRRLKEFEVYEIGLVDIPANPGAAVLEFKKYSNDDFIIIKETDSMKGKKMEMDLKKLRETVEEVTGPMQGQVEALKDDYVTMEENIESQKKLLKLVEDQQADLQKGRMTKTEFDTFAQKVGVDLIELQKDLKRQVQAGKIINNRTPYQGWKSINSDIKVVFDEKGTPLGDKYQKAYHLLQAPYEFKGAGDEGKKLKDLRDLNDITVISDAYFKRMMRGTYSIENLKCYKMFKQLLNDFDPSLAKAMYSTGAGVGDEWVPTEFSSQLHEAYELSMNVESHIPRWEMPSNSAQYPVSGAKPQMYRVGEATVNNPDQMIKSNRNTKRTLFTTETFGVAVLVSPELIEDSIIAIAPDLRAKIAEAMVEGNESRMINADDTTPGTHMDTAADWATDQSYPEAYEKGFRKLSIAASNNVDAQSVSAGVGDGTAAFTAEDVRGLRKSLGKMGHRAKDLVYITSISVWLNMLSFDQYSQVGTYGANASWLTGDLPSFDGSPLVVTSELSEGLESTGLETGSSSLKGLLAVNKTDFKMGYRRGITLEFDKDILTQQLAFVATQRNSFKSMATATEDATAYLINIP